MKCECKKVIEAKLLARFQEQNPKTRSHGIELSGYAMAISDDGGITLRPAMLFTASHIVKAKDGREIPPMAFMVDLNGLPFAIFDPAGGAGVNHPIADERAFLVAVKKAIGSSGAGVGERDSSQMDMFEAAQS